MSSFNRLATTVASTKRVGAVVNGLTPDPTENIASMFCIPLMNLDANIAQEYEFRFREVLQTFVKGSQDVVEGDLLVISTVEYPIRAVENWPWKDEVVLRLIVDQIK